MSKDYSFAGFYRADGIAFSTEGATCLKCGKQPATYFNFQDALCEGCIALVFGPPRDPETHRPEPQSRFWVALERLFYARTWGGWRRALFGYLLIVALLGVIWAMVLTTSDLYAHPGMMWGLVVIASPASLLFLLALSRLFLAIKEPLILLTKFALTAALLLFAVWVIVYVLPLVFPESPWAYAVRYSTDASRVQVARKPADCDFLHAPIGFKECHYEKSVQVTCYSADVESGRPIVSYDNGKTWSQLPEGEKPGRAQVYVNWEKVGDGQ